MSKAKKQLILLIIVATVSMQPFATRQAKAVVCISIDSFLVLQPYIEKYQEIKAWWDALEEMKALFETNINMAFGCDENSGQKGSEIGMYGSEIPGSWYSIESTIPDESHPIFDTINEGSAIVSSAVEPETIQAIASMPKNEADRFTEWINGNASDVELAILSLPKQVSGSAADMSNWLKESYGNIEEGAKAMGANPIWLSEDKDSQLEEVVFSMPEGLHEEEGYGWVIQDEFVIPLNIEGDDAQARRETINRSIQDLYAVEQIKQKASFGANEYRIFLSGKSESYVLDHVELAREGNEDSIDIIKDTFRTPDYAEQRIIDGRKYVAVNEAIDKDLIRMTRQHLRGLSNINAVTLEQEKIVRNLKKRERGATDYEMLKWDVDTTDVAVFFTNSASDQDVDLLRHNYPLMPILRHDLAYLRNNPQFRTGEILLSGQSDPRDVLRVANILLGRTTDVDPVTVTLDPNAEDEYQLNGWNYLVTNNVLRDGLTRLTLAREYLDKLEGNKKKYTPEILDGSEIGDLHLLRTRSEIELHSVKSHVLESQLRKERLLGIYMTLEMSDTLPELDYDVN